MRPSETMRAARLHRPRGEEGGEDLRVEDVPVPTARPHEVLVGVQACGVCASDLHVVQGVTPTPTLPITLGHEAAGVIVHLGSDVTGWEIGERVIVPALWTCGSCLQCRSGRTNLCEDQAILSVTADGALAEYVLAPARLLTPVPDVIPIEQAAILADAVATPYHALNRADIHSGMTCLIIGLGGLGMHAIALAKLRGVAVIAVDIQPEILERATRWGADEVVDGRIGDVAATVRALTNGGVDRSFEFVGTTATAGDAIKSLRPGGRATLVGIGSQRLSGPPLGLFVSREIEVFGCFGQTHGEVREVVRLAADGELDLSRSITGLFALDETKDALRLLESDEDHPIRSVVQARPGNLLR